jgi:hypothetical protein
MAITSQRYNRRLSRTFLRTQAGGGPLQPHSRCSSRPGCPCTAAGDVGPDKERDRCQCSSTRTVVLASLNAMQSRATSIGSTSGRCFYPGRQASMADRRTKVGVDVSSPGEGPGPPALKLTSPPARDYFVSAILRKLSPLLRRPPFTIWRTGRHPIFAIRCRRHRTRQVFGLARMASASKLKRIYILVASLVAILSSLSSISLCKSSDKYFSADPITRPKKI